MTLFERVKEISKKRGYSLTEVSTKAGMGEKSLYRWKENEPSADRLKAVADVLGVSVDYLLGNTDEPTPKRAPETPDIKKMLDGSLTYDGKPLSDHDRDVVRIFLETLKSEG
ncbi:helix-turn-helix domain-containing protein [Weissella ceti]|uniref:Helix-turn-helix domain-containing protein n=1 Tax=Weissella ceti TaxID=759620 RepID=A0ABT3E3P5_9LACO|nr:helix-turn-helix transcriptional regulator [Weissella ceti]MCW0953039.1 helix-turn-helix domain-containing protein [Weissella ceti]QVK11584.1 helix-turn-helix transcriptional regulator [Weissella ceti]